MIKIDKIKFTKEIKSIIKNLDDEISYYTNVDISWYDRYSDNSYIYLLKDDDKFAIVFGIVLSYVSFNNIVSALKLKTVGKYSALTVLSLLTGVAIYIGRFLRFNSWDVLTNLNGLIDFVKSGFTKEAIYFIILFAVFHFFVITIIDFINVKGR